MSGTMNNVDKPLIRCGMCNGVCKIASDPLYKRGARIIRCTNGCSWSDFNHGRVDPSWYWRLRVKLGI